MSSPEPTSSINKINHWDRGQIFLALLPARERDFFKTPFRTPNDFFEIAFALVWALLKSPFTPYGRAKSWKRIIADRFVLLLATGTNRKQLRAISGSTRGTYDNFVREAKLTPCVEDIGDNAKLLWIGPKTTDNVLLYFHGMWLDSPHGQGHEFW